MHRPCLRRPLFAARPEDAFLLSARPAWGALPGRRDLVWSTWVTQSGFYVRLLPANLPRPQHSSQRTDLMPQRPIELYYWPTPNGHKITIMLEECGLPYEIRPVNIGRG